MSKNPDLKPEIVSLGRSRHPRRLLHVLVSLTILESSQPICPYIMNDLRIAQICNESCPNRPNFAWHGNPRWPYRQPVASGLELVRKFPWHQNLSVDCRKGTQSAIAWRQSCILFWVSATWGNNSMDQSIRSTGLPKCPWPMAQTVSIAVWCLVRYM